MAAVALAALGALALQGPDLFALTSSFRPREATQHKSHFNISATRTRRAIGQGESARVGFWVIRSRRFGKSLKLSSAGLPKGSIVRFTSSTVSPVRTYTRMTIITRREVRPGTYKVVVRAGARVSGRQITRSSSFKLIVRRNEAFTVTAVPGLPLRPGVSRPLDLRLGNPNGFPIRIKTLVGAIAERTSAPACSGSANFTVANIPPARVAVGLSIPARSTRSLAELGVAEADRPRLAMINLPANQDACKGASFTIGYSGIAVRR
jgi:hypothetical protein